MKRIKNERTKEKNERTKERSFARIEEVQLSLRSHKVTQIIINSISLA